MFLIARGDYSNIFCYHTHDDGESRVFVPHNRILVLLLTAAQVSLSDCLL